MGFVHLHLHSEYSLLDGACRVAQIPRAAKAAGQTAVAVTDHGNLFAAYAFYLACKEEGVKPIIGCEVYVAPRSMSDREGKKDVGGNHLILLCENEKGYRNLCQLVSLSYIDGFYGKPRIDLSLLESHTEGLICLSACLAGFIPQAILAGNFDGAVAYAERLDAMFGHGNFYLEVQDHGLAEDRTVCGGLLEISRKTGIPLAATNDVHYLSQSDAYNQAILLCIQTASVITDGRPIGFETDEFYFKSTEQMERLFALYPDACENTCRIAERCEFSFPEGQLFLPKYPSDGEDVCALLRRKCFDGMKERERLGQLSYETHSKETYIERAEYELSVICDMGFADYYLIVSDYVNYAKSEGIPVGPGRGSGAGSIVAFFCGITDIDSLKFDLLFERFLNPERVSMPDFDVDFCYNRRDEVIEYVKRRYGDEHVSQIITFGTMAARAAIRDVGRALGMSYSSVDAVAKAVPRGIDVTLSDAMKTTAFRTLYERSAEEKRLIDIAMALEGMPRNASTHAAGVVITERPVSDYVPLARNGETVVTQFDMNTVAKLGLVKFDFLALRNLTIIKEAEDRITEGTGTPFDVSRVPLSDEATFRLLSSGNTIGVFQLEKGGMRQVLTRLKPETLDDIIATIALYRPGPMDSIPKYIERRRGRAEVTYLHPALEKILGVTYGCIVYQEQVMEIVRTLAGFSMGHADEVRRAMAKKKVAAMEAEREKFLSGCRENGIGEDVAQALFDDMASFASYAFNKSHAAAYAVISYRTAYLKAHDTKYYMAALLSSVFGNFEKTAEYIAECGKYGIRVLPPSINESGVSFTVSGEHIRFGLLALKNVGQLFIESIINERKKGKFTSFPDFLSRMQGNPQLNKRQVEALIKCGAFDGLDAKRSQLYATYEAQMDMASEKGRNEVSGQIDMFSAFEDASPASTFSYPDIPEYTARQKLMLEKESSGMYFTGHILDDYTEAEEDLPHIPLSEIVAAGGETGDGDEDGVGEPGDGTFRDGETVDVIGILSKVSDMKTKKGDKMAFVTLEDRFAEIELVVFPKVYERCAGFLQGENAVIVRGNIQLRDEERPRILVNTMTLIPQNGAYRHGAVTLPAQRAGADRSGTGKNGEKAEGQGRGQAGEKTDAGAACASIPANRPPRQKKLYLRVPDLGSRQTQLATNLVEIFRGSTPVVLYDDSRKTYVPYTGGGADPSPRLISELTELLGEGHAVLQ